MFTWRKPSGIPVTNSQAEMDEQVLCLTKLLVDSLNEKEIAKRREGSPGGCQGHRQARGLLHDNRFWSRPVNCAVPQGFAVAPLDRIGHRKGSAYDKTIARLGVAPSRKPDAVARLLEEGVAMMRALRANYIDE